MPIDWAPFVALVQRHQRFLLTTHVRPDPDGLGSQLGLDDVLRRLGKETRLVISSTWPPRYDFMDPGRCIEQFVKPGDAWRDVDVIVILDTGTRNQLGDFAAFLDTLTVPKVVIDHHLSQDDLGALQLVDTTAEATGRLVYEAAQALGVALSPEAAEFLFAAVGTDTGWFRHSNTTAATFALAEDLVRAGARPTLLYEQLYERNTLPRLRLMGLVLDRLQISTDGQLAYTEVRREDYAATGAIPQDTEELINYPRSLAGVEVALLFMEQPAGGVKVSFRARSRVDVSRVAEQFGGGGHRLASGATLQTTLPEARARVMEAVRAALGAEA
ncbi:MAG: bifunctional oligoribonuclease/PAP phosphatase NrnA [Gemmataceae bacterium]|nr:bifunctional oligoribonuclease/PAP phosphatase NrnA [Gemmataceae bacterium]